MVWKKRRGQEKRIAEKRRDEKEGRGGEEGEEDRTGEKRSEGREAGAIHVCYRKAYVSLIRKFLMNFLCRNLAVMQEGDKLSLSEFCVAKTLIDGKSEEKVGERESGTRGRAAGRKKRQTDRGRRKLELV